ncbi:ATP-binding protein [Rhodococcus rhodnii]|uniref:ATP-binding protein n=1 Tax=Rhodococcus rhodnii TaxID=38312 RepID=A0A6P2CIF2_9NOCA|nr:ATP-binding protein [Rhodococcus rhodnii]
MPRFERRAGGRIVGGVAGGVADQLGVDATRVRTVFAALGVVGGAGFALYGLLWVFTPQGSDTARPSRDERTKAYGLIVLAIVAGMVLSAAFSGATGTIVGPAVVIAVGAALVWREFDSGGPKSMLGLPQRPTVLTWARVVGGVSLIVVGLAVVVLAQVEFDALRSSLAAVVVTLVGAALLTVPLWLRLWRSLEAERAARIRTDERDEIASHLHDSVLQTLALIQKQSGDAAEVARLARSQERELRRYLFGGGENAHSSLAEALATIAGEVEDQYSITVRPVTVGDVALGDGAEQLSQEAFTAVVGATREALVNAAKHSGESEVNLYMEAEPDQVSVFVRDRGKGFDAEAVPADRQGLARSIRGRIERRGGRVDVRTSAGRGTEVRIHLPRGVVHGQGEGGDDDGDTARSGGERRNGRSTRLQWGRRSARLQEEQAQ